MLDRPSHSCDGYWFVPLWNVRVARLSSCAFLAVIVDHVLWQKHVARRATFFDELVFLVTEPCRMCEQPQAAKYFVSGQGLDQRTAYNISAMDTGPQLGESLKLSMLCMKTGFTHYLTEETLGIPGSFFEDEPPQRCAPSSYLYQYTTLRPSLFGLFESAMCLLQASQRAQLVTGAPSCQTRYLRVLCRNERWQPPMCAIEAFHLCGRVEATRSTVATRAGLTSPHPPQAEESSRRMCIQTAGQVDTSPRRVHTTWGAGTHQLQPDFTVRERTAGVERRLQTHHPSK